MIFGVLYEPNCVENQQQIPVPITAQTAKRVRAVVLQRRETPTPWYRSRFQQTIKSPWAHHTHAVGGGHTNTKVPVFVCWGFFVSEIELVY